MSHIFISHVEEDADIALEIALGLEEAGYTTWYYELDSIPGPSYLIQTGQAIEQSDVVVLVISPHSLGSHQVTREVVRAYEGAKRFIPVLRGITHTEFQNRQPEWREAVGAATSIYLTKEGVAGILARVIDGLKALGIHPASKPNAARIGRIHSTLDEIQARGIPAPVPIAPAVRRPPAEVRAPAVRRAHAVWFWLGFLIFAAALGILTAVLMPSYMWEDPQRERVSILVPGLFLGPLLIRLSRRSIRHGWFWPGAVMFVSGGAAFPTSLYIMHKSYGPINEWVGSAVAIVVFFVLEISVAAFCLWRGWPRTGVKHPRGEVSAFLIAASLPVLVFAVGFIVASVGDIGETGETGERDILTFSDDFEDGVADGWHLGSGWRVELVDGNYVLSGLGGQGGQDFPGAWPDVTEALNYAVEADFMFLSGALPFQALSFNVRQSSAGRYVVWILPHRVDLGKGTEDAIPVVLYDADVDIGFNEWHTVDIALDGSNIKVYIDGNLEINYWDENPIAQGIFDLHSSPDSSVYVDNILVGTGVPAGALTGNRGILSFSDDFEDGVADGWHLGPGWRVELVDGNYVLSGLGGQGGQDFPGAWPDVTEALNYAVEADFMFLSGALPFRALNFNVRQSSAGRYVVWILPHRVDLGKETEDAIPVMLYDADVDIGFNEWHTVDIALDGSNIKVYIDGNLEIDYWDENPIAQGSFALHSHPDSSVYVDNILVGTGVPAGALTGNRGILSFSDDFEDGVADGWYLDPGWQVMRDNGNYVLSGGGPGHPQAEPLLTEAVNYAVKADFVVLSGILEFNIRDSRTAHYCYIVCLTYQNVTLTKAWAPPADLATLYSADVDIGFNEWHTVDIALDGSNIKVYIDGNLEIDYWDADPHPAGNFRFMVNNSDACVDNISVRPYP